MSTVESEFEKRERELTEVMVLSCEEFFRKKRKLEREYLDVQTRILRDLSNLRAEKEARHGHTNVL